MTARELDLCVLRATGLGLVVWGALLVFPTAAVVIHFGSEVLEYTHVWATPLWAHLLEPAFVMVFGVGILLVASRLGRRAIPAPELRADPMIVLYLPAALVCAAMLLRLVPAYSLPEEEHFAGSCIVRLFPRPVAETVLYALLAIGLGIAYVRSRPRAPRGSAPA